MEKWLGSDCVGFLHRIFKLFSTNGSSLSLGELKQIFYPIEDQMEEFDYKNLIVTDCETMQGELIPMQSWILFWSYLAHENYLQCYKYLRYIGYYGKLSEALGVTK